MNNTDILHPVLALILLHSVILIVLVVVRIGAMRNLNLKFQDAKHTSDLDSPTIPDYIRQVGANYNNLCEVPTVFYALIFYIWAVGHVDSIHVLCAWAFFFSRVAHSLVQVTFNKVFVRFTIFFIGWSLIITMSLRELFSYIT